MYGNGRIESINTLLDRIPSYEPPPQIQDNMYTVVNAEDGPLVTCEPLPAQDALELPPKFVNVKAIATTRTFSMAFPGDFDFGIDIPPAPGQQSKKTIEHRVGRLS